MRAVPKLAFALAVLSMSGLESPLERGIEAFRRRDFASAEQAFRQAVQAQPSSAAAHKWLGMAYAAEGNFAAAEEPFRRACSLDPRKENACYYLGRTLYAVDRYEDALKAFALASRNASERGRVSLGRALAFDALGKGGEAEVEFEEAIRAGEPTALKEYGLFLYRHGRLEESLVVLRKANAKEEIARVRRALESAPARGKVRPAPPPVQFKTTTLPMIVSNGAFGDKHQIETMLAGVAVFDYDNDGWPDIFVANGAEIPALIKSGGRFRNRLFRNNRDGTFTDVTDAAGLAGSGYSMGVAAADYDNDGWVDLFVTGVRSNTLYRNRGDGTFEDVTARAGVEGGGLWAVAAGWFDYDNDGRLDLFVARYVEWNPATEPYCGLLKPGYRTYCHPKYYQPLPNALYHNEGNGRFRDISDESGIAAHAGKGMGIAFGDYDGDGRLDVFVANDTAPNFLFHNLGNGRFEEVAVNAGVAYNADGQANSWMGADFRDYDNDGREDIFVTALSNETFSLFRNLGKGRFAEISGPAGLSAASLPWSGWSTGFVDFNNEGFKDIFVAGGNVIDNAELTTSRKSRQPNQLLVNQGDGTFRMMPLPGEALHRGAAFGDFNRDGRMDVVVTRLNESPLVLWNVSAAGHWLALRLVGTESNRDGIGALIHVTADSGEFWNRVTTSVGYAGSSDRVAHFGLGGAARAGKVEIGWPSGVHQVLENVPADQYLTVREPSR